jgi:hypothetical protein
MARSRNTVPAYRKHQQTGRAVVSIYRADGWRTEVILTGDFGSEVSKQEYDRLLAQLRSSGGKLPTKPATKDITLAEFVPSYLAFAEAYYIDSISKEPTTEQESIKEACRPLIRLFGKLPINAFDSLCLERVQHAMASGSTLTDVERDKKIKHNRPIGTARTTINRHIDRTEWHALTSGFAMVAPRQKRYPIARTSCARAKRTQFFEPMNVVTKGMPPHTPIALDDTIEQGALFCNMLLPDNCITAQVAHVFL